MNHSPNFEILDENFVLQTRNIFKKFEYDQTNLIGILLEVQDLVPNHYIPMEVAAFVGDELSVPLSRVYDVISFYAALSDMPKAENVIQLCKSVVCRTTGYPVLRESLENILGIKMGEITGDKKFALEYSACFGACDIAPAIRINTKVYGNLTEFKLNEIINSYK